MKRRLAAALLPLAFLLGPLCHSAGAAPVCSWGKLVPINLCIGR